MNDLRFHKILLLATCLLVASFELCHGQNSTDPAFKNESKIVNTMLSDSLSTFSNDTLTIQFVYYENGSMKYKRVFYHPEGAPINQQELYLLNYAESDYHEDGRIAQYRELYGRKLHGDCLMFDSDKFVTHWVFENGNLIDVKNNNCRYVDHKGKTISKHEFLKRLQSEYGQWGYGYYLFFPKYDPYSRLNCCDFIMYPGNKYSVPGQGKAADKLIKRLNRTCQTN